MHACPICTHLLEPDARRCPECGASVVRADTTVQAGEWFLRGGLGLLGAIVFLAVLFTLASLFRQFGG
ncbi:MAG: hypothetical protein VKP72_03885 [bacterium]|nr:hypothetical protein [bacterium]